MTHAKRISIWPFICIAVCLLVLCLLAPRAWLSLANRRNGDGSLVAFGSFKPDVAPDDRARQTAPQPSVETPFEPAPIADFLPAPEIASVCPPVAERLDVAPLGLRDSTQPVASDALPRNSAPDAGYGPPAGEPPAPMVDAEPPAESPDSVLEKEAPSFTPAPPGCWPRAHVLLNELRELSQQDQTREWALALLGELEAFERIGSLRGEEAESHLQRLARLAEAANQIDAQSDSIELRSRLRRTTYGLIKRLQLWDAVHRLAERGELFHKASYDIPRMQQSLSEVETLVRPLHDAEAWRKFLLLDESWQLARQAGDDAGREQLAVAVLTRLESPQLTDIQHAFLSKPAVANWRLELCHWATRPIDYPQLLEVLERHESGSGDEDARALAHYARTLRWSPNDDLVELGQLIDAHWRNANVRVAVSGELINRLLPPPPPRTVEPVQDRIRGALVFGRSESHTEGLFVRLLPDRTRLRLGLEAKGLVASETAAASGPVRVFNEGLARFRARKLLTVDRRGLKMAGTESETDSNTVMTGLETEYDGFPLVGALVRSIAMQQVEQQAGDAKWEVEEKLAARVSRRLDEAVQHKLMDAERKFQQKVLLPLRRLDLDPQPVEMQTTAERLIVRYRLAGDDQLAAHTPRPQAPGDSLMSIQVHQSGVNNALQKLKLGGRRLQLEQLYREVAAMLGRKDAEIPDDLPEGITVEFARHDPVHVDFLEGQILLTLRFTEIAVKGGAKWNDFLVRGTYFPEVSGLRARLARDGIVSLDTLDEDRPLTLGERLALQSIFVKVLSKRQVVELIPPAMRKEPRIADLQISQFVIDGGWIGAAFNSRSPSVRPAAARIGGSGQCGKELR